MQNVKQIWEETAKQLEKVYDGREASNITYLLLEDSFGITRGDILASVNKEVDRDELKRLIDRLLMNEPLQYVTGIADFYGRKFHIAPVALIPRPETEELCSLIISENKSDKPRILDVGVGSGCIAITLSKELESTVFGTDVSEEALVIAKKNAALNHSNAIFYKSNVLTEGLPEKELDILVSNPPYIPLSDKDAMHQNVLDFEPEQALFVPDEDPIIFYKRIADAGRESLKPEGRLYFEIHERFGKEVVSYLNESGFMYVQIHQDMQGKDRMISATNSANR